MSQARNKRNKKTGLREGKSVSRKKLSTGSTLKKDLLANKNLESKTVFV